MLKSLGACKRWCDGDIVNASYEDICNVKLFEMIGKLMTLQCGTDWKSRQKTLAAGVLKAGASNGCTLCSISRAEVSGSGSFKRAKDFVLYEKRRSEHSDYRNSTISGNKIHLCGFGEYALVNGPG